MVSDRNLTIEERAQLAIFLVDEGIAYQNGQAGHPDCAVVRYAQSLSVFRSLNAPNETWLAFILHNIGQFRADTQQKQQALAFFESAAYIQQRLEVSKDAADMLWQIVQSMFKLEAYTQAQHWLEKVEAMYQALGLTDSIETLRTESRKFLSAQRHPQGPRTSPFNQTHAFEIRVFGERKEPFRVTSDGVVHWSIVSEINRPVALGLTGWDVVCVDF